VLYGCKQVEILLESRGKGKEKSSQPSLAEAQV